MRKTRRLCLAVLPALLLAAALPSAAKRSDRSKAGSGRGLAVRPSVELPADYAAVLAKAAKAKATLVVLPIRRPSDGAERAFAFAEEALQSGLFAKVSVGDDLGKADYAVAGTWDADHAVSLKGGHGLGEWMDLSTSVRLELLFEGGLVDVVEAKQSFGQVHTAPPFTPARLLRSATQGLTQHFQWALYRLAVDINKRSGR